MNTMYQKVAVGAGLALSISLISCQETRLVNPSLDKPAAVASLETVNALISPSLPKTYVLTKHGAVNLTYYADGRLRRVMSSINGRGNTNYRREYTYDDADHRIDAFSYIDGNPVTYDAYWIDEQTGRCTQSKEVGYLATEENKAYYKTHELTTMWLYSYTDKGQLKTCRHWLWDSSNRTEYTYNAADDLIKTITYDRVGNQNGVAIHALSLIYVPQLRGLASEDKYPLNASWTHLPVYHPVLEGQPVPELYLKIFGKKSKHLLTDVVQTKLPDNRYSDGSSFTYVLNADGYVTERKEYDQRAGTLTETKPYDYLVSTIGIKL